MGTKGGHSSMGFQLAVTVSILITPLLLQETQYLCSKSEELNCRPPVPTDRQSAECSRRP